MKTQTSKFLPHIAGVRTMAVAQMGRQVVPAAEVGNDATYHCKDVRAMPLASIDPSLAIGFYCRTAGQPHSALQLPILQLRQPAGLDDGMKSEWIG